VALIQCTECNKQISDKAAACPGCGCPVEEIINVVVDLPSDIDYSKFSREELCNKAFEMQCKSSYRGAQNAVEMYSYIISNYNNSSEAKYAMRQLRNIKKQNANKNAEAECAASDSSHNNADDIDVCHNTFMNVGEVNSNEVGFGAKVNRAISVNEHKSEVDSKECSDSSNGFCIVQDLVVGGAIGGLLFYLFIFVEEYQLPIKNFVQVVLLVSTGVYLRYTFKRNKAVFATISGFIVGIMAPVVYIFSR